MNRYKCVNGHSKCREMYPGPECPYCELRIRARTGKAVGVPSHWGAVDPEQTDQYGPKPFSEMVESLATDKSKG